MKTSQIQEIVQRYEERTWVMIRVYKGARATINASLEFQLSLNSSSKPHHSDAAVGFEPNTDFSNVRARKMMLTKPPRKKLKRMITDPGSVEGR